MTKMLQLVVGLGNPGKKYEMTRHNIGFMVMDKLASVHSVSWRDGFQGEYAKVDTALDGGGHSFYLLKPSTYMNLSGESVSALCRYFKIPTDSILVIHDELDFDYGTMKLRKDGSAAGHNGIKSIIAHVGSQSFARVRMGVAGISRAQIRGFTAEYVLAPFTKEEQGSLGDFIELGASAATFAAKHGVEKAMLEFNKR